MVRVSLTLADVPLPALASTAASIEAAGFAGIFLGDHVLTPLTTASRYPYAANVPAFSPSAPRPDPLIALGHMAAVTTRISLGTAVLVAPLRHPVLLARAAATVQELSSGRLVLGLGAGWLAEEFEAMGVPFVERGTYLDEMMTALPQLLRGSLPDGSGPVYRVPAVDLNPVPPVIPILVGGHGPRVLRRAARADGWIGPPVGLKEAAELHARIVDERRALGVADRPFRTIMRLPAHADRSTVATFESAGFGDVAYSPFRSGGLDPRAAAEVLHDELSTLADRLGVDAPRR